MKKIYFTVVLLALAAIASAQNVIDVSINDLTSNPARAQLNYGNKTIRVTGRVMMITDITSLMIDGGILVYLNSSERAKVVNLNEGQRITVRGVFDATVTPAILRAVIEATPAPQQQTQPQPAPAPTTQPQQGTTQSLPAQLRGTWVFRRGPLTLTQPNKTIVITGDTVTKYIEETGYNFSIENWTPVRNPNNVSRRNFPSGYFLQFGNNVGMYIYLDNNGQRLIVSEYLLSRDYSDPGNNPPIYNKQ